MIGKTSFLNFPGTAKNLFLGGAALALVLTELILSFLQREVMSVSRSLQSTLLRVRMLRIVSVPRD
ncbi:hypothetical protein P167DRAFT_166941 [Morchella conica CCBAS932]|uniref:Uncharacterized protein n=1 Tax=Morchella conica CCBAS932 TaxID=1392247 RepID=A0A3N4KNH8_9PEZI|nr:hypothetical protein P167DRAFT_166941 [Morchella conica CCBAS932]